MDILYGKNPVLEALRAGRGVRKLVIASGVRGEPRLREILSLASVRGILIEETSRSHLDDIAHSEHHQGIAGYFHTRPPVSLDTLLDQSITPQLLLALDGIQDPHNLGALTRTADAVGADGIIIPKHRSVSVTPAAAKAAAGATEHVPITVVPNMVHALQRLAAAGIWRIGLAEDGTQRYDTFDYTVPIVIVVGAEGDGMHPLTRRHCDVVVSIPMAGKVSSLNATVAGSILLYEVARQRSFAPR